MAATANENRQPYRILSLDGGGSWALIQIRALQNMYGRGARGHEVLRHFHLVVANSGGSIAAMAMAENWTLEEITELYLNGQKRRQIFVNLNFLLKSVGRNIIKQVTGVGPKYKTKEKYEGLRKILKNIGDKKLVDLPAYIGPGSPHFVIVTFDYDRERATFFRSDRHSRAQTHKIAEAAGKEAHGSFDEVTVAQALHATSNAPLNFFDEPALITYGSSPRPKRFWDGAVGGYNNPVMAGLTEAISNGYLLEQIRVLSIGTGSAFLPLKQVNPQGLKSANEGLCKDPEKQSLANDIAKMSTSILSDPPDAATYTAYTLLQAYSTTLEPRLVRLNPVIQPILHKGQWVLPIGLTQHDFERLVKLDMDAVEQKDVELIDKFCRLWLQDHVPNQPVRSDSQMAPILGYGRFGEGKAAALQMLQHRQPVAGGVLA